MADESYHVPLSETFNDEEVLLDCDKAIADVNDVDETKLEMNVGPAADALLNANS